MGLITGNFEGAPNAAQKRGAAAVDQNAQLPLFMKYRWVFVLLFLFPMSVLFDVFWWLRKKLRQRTTAAERHEDEVRKVQKQIHDWRAAGASKRLCTTRPAWMAMSLKQNLYKNELCQIEVNMQSILEVNEAQGTVRLEPFVTVGEITSRLVPLGWTLQVVPELDDLTVGGLIMGTGIESSSHKYGLFQDICESFEILDSHGDVVRCSRTERPELFHAIPWSYGTLGFLVAATLRMTRCKRYVRVEYLPCTSKEEFVRVFQEQSCKESPHEFVEGLAYSPDTGVVMVGDYCDAPAPGEKVNNITLWFKPWFYQHVKGILANKKKTVECIPLRPYYHRHTRGIFWQMEEILPFGNNPWFRLFFGWVYPIKVSMLKLTTPQHLHKFYESKFICQDMLVPIANLAESLMCFNEHVGIYPLWLCPHRLYREEHQGMIFPDKGLKPGQFQMFVDIGCYGFSPNEAVRAPLAVRNIEKFVKNVSGFQMLYADTYLSRDDFWAMFDGTLYNKMRKEMDAESGFPDVYDKVRKR